MWRLLAIALIGCGRIGFDASPVASDADGDDAPGDAANTCIQRWLDGTVTFGPPERILELSTATSERDPFLANDDRTLYFARGGDILVATRSARGSPFGLPTPAVDLSSAANDLRVALTADGLEAFAARDTGATISIVRASRMSAAGPFSTATVAVDGSNDDLDPEISDDGLRLYYAPTPGQNMQAVAVATRVDRTSPFTLPPQTLTELDGPAADGDPSLPSDERLIVFTRSFATNTFDLHYATRSTPTGPFSAPIPIPVVNAAGATYDADGAISADGCELFFASDRLAPFSDFDLYRAVVQ